MTERHDDLASAWLDGELSDAERQALATGGPEGDEVRRARRDLAAIRDALAAPVAAPDGLAELQIARAVELADLPATGDARVIGLRPRRRGRRSGTGLLARAAVTALALGGLGVGVAAVVDDGSTAQDDAALTASGGGGAAGTSQSAQSAESAESADEAGGEESSTFGVAPGEESAEAGPVASAASELVEAGDLDAAGLLASLERLFGPAATWPAEPPPADTCIPALTAADGDGAPVAAVPLERGEVPLELVVPAAGDPYFVERGPCRRVG